MRRGTLDVEVRLPDEPDTPLAGALTFLDNAIQDGTGNVTLRATIPNGDHRLWPGRFVKVRLVLSIQPDAVMVPAAAPQMSARGQFVYVIAPDATAELRLVKTGQRQGDFVVVEQGLKAGERVVVNGQLGVTPGGKVHEDGGATAGTAPAPATAGAQPAPSAAPARSAPSRTAEAGDRGKS
jgi:multidrug efflux system membrane fusion protein